MAIHIGLRSIGKKSNKAITIALWVAICAHIIAWFYWHPVNRISAPELPDWVNIKMVVGFEQQVEPKPQPEPIIKPVPVPVQKKQVEEKTVEKPNKKAVAKQKPSEVIEEQSEPASASTFVQADSKPFVMENPKPVYPSAAGRCAGQGIAGNASQVISRDIRG